MTSPSIAVIIPAYNAAEHIGGAVASAWTCGASEIVVVDDGSTDGTAGTAVRCGATVLQQPNAGASAARSAGLATVTSTYVVFLDADDELLPHGVVASLKLLEEDAELSAAGGRTVGVWPDDSERLLPARVIDLSPTGLVTAGEGAWTPGAMVIRRSALQRSESVAPHPLRPRFSEDYELILRLSLVGPVVAHDEPAIRYRVFEGKSHHNLRAALDAKQRIRAYYGAWLNVPIKTLGASAAHAQVKLHGARHAQAYSKRVVPVALLGQAFLHDPVYAIRGVRNFVRRRLAQADKTSL